MANKKDISDLFKDNEHKLVDTPSPMAWRKLERKLDRHRSRSQMHVVRMLSMAASLVLLVGAVYLFASTYERPNTSTNVAAAPAMSSMEELSSDFGDAKPILTKLGYQRAMQSNQAPIINEGPKGKRLIVVGG